MVEVLKEDSKDTAVNQLYVAYSELLTLRTYYKDRLLDLNNLHRNQFEGEKIDGQVEEIEDIIENLTKIIDKVK